MRCPVCADTALVSRRWSDVEVEQCPGCGGWWFDALELERILLKPPREWIRQDLTAAKAVDRPAGVPRTCPRCGGAGSLIPLNTRLRPGTIVDSCGVCYGCWVDAGELAHIAREDTLSSALRRLLRLGDQ